MRLGKWKLRRIDKMIVHMIPERTLYQTEERKLHRIKEMMA